MALNLSKDEDVNFFFDEVASILTQDVGLPASESLELVRDYYKKFTDGGYCKKLKIPVQDDDFFFHESERGMALRVYYYLKLQGDPSPRKFIEWRSNRYN